MLRRFCSPQHLGYESALSLPTSYAVEHERVLVWRLPSAVSQDSLGGRPATRSMAGSVVTLRLAELLHRTDASLQYPTSNIFPTSTFRRLPAGHDMNKLHVTSQEHPEDIEVTPPPEKTICPHLLSCLVDAILTGNEKHEDAVDRLIESGEPFRHKFSLLQANDLLGRQFLEVDYCVLRGPMGNHLTHYIKLIKNHPNLCNESRSLLVLSGFDRSILVVYERSRDLLGVFDANSHGQEMAVMTGTTRRNSGALIATCRFENVKTFSKWIAKELFPESAVLPMQDFELSLLQFTGQLSLHDCAFSALQPPRRISIFGDSQTRIAQKRPYEADSDESSEEEDPKRSLLLPLPKFIDTVLVSHKAEELEEPQLDMMNVSSCSLNEEMSRLSQTEYKPSVTDSEYRCDLNTSVQTIDLFEDDEDDDFEGDSSRLEARMQTYRRNGAAVKTEPDQDTGYPEHLTRPEDPLLLGSEMGHDPLLEGDDVGPLCSTFRCESDYPPPQYDLSQIRI